MSRLWSWPTVTGQRIERDDRGRLRTVEAGDDLSGLVGILHELHGSAPTGGRPRNDAIAKCSKPSDYCRIHLVAYQSSLGGWVCTSPPTAEHECYPGTRIETRERDGIEYTICDRCTPARWHQGPQVSIDPKRGPRVRSQKDSDGRPEAIADFIRGIARDVIRVHEKSRTLHILAPQTARLAGVASWVLGRPTNQSITHGEPGHDEVAFFAEWVRARARERRPWEAKA